MTYFSDFDYQQDYDNPAVRDRILHDIEEQYYDESAVETDIPWDLLNDL